MRTVVMVEKRGKWARPDPNQPRQCCACSATSDRRKPMPSQWEHHVDNTFTCSTFCRLARGTK